MNESEKGQKKDTNPGVISFAQEQFTQRVCCCSTPIVGFEGGLNQLRAQQEGLCLLILSQCFILARIDRF